MHRQIMIMVHGEDAVKGKVVMHKCDNPACFRYDHLTIGTQADNMRDMHSKGRDRNGNQLKTHCKHGHEFTEENTTRTRRGGRECKTCRGDIQRRYRAREATK